MYIYVWMSRFVQHFVCGRRYHIHTRTHTHTHTHTPQESRLGVCRFIQQHSICGWGHNQSYKPDSGRCHSPRRSSRCRDPFQGMFIYTYMHRYTHTCTHDGAPDPEICFKVCLYIHAYTYTHIRAHATGFQMPIFAPRYVYISIHI